MMDVLFAWLQTSPAILWCVGVFLAGAAVGFGLTRVVARRRVVAWIGGPVLGLACLGTVWAAEYVEPLPRFVLDAHDIGQVVPVGQSRLAWLADRVHGRKYLVLSFDDGPSNPRTDSAILAILARHHAHAVFFSVCAHALSADGRAALRADVAAGDLVEDHSWTHPHLTQQPAAVQHHEIADSRAFLRQLTGQSVDWFRPPFGQADPAVRTQIRQAGMQEVMWGANSQDSWLRSPSDIQHWSTRQACNGAILLLHSHATTAAALDATLSDLERMGYRFVMPVT